jgi:hypothetical protein
MKYLKPIFLTLCVMITSILYSQSFTNADNQYDYSGIQLGFGGKLNIELGQKRGSYRLSLGIGVANPIYTYVSPSFHSEIQIYNGGLGAPLSVRKKKIYIDWVNSFTLTAGYFDGDMNFYEKFTPLYYFSTLSVNPLQNVYHTSISWGSNLIVSSDPFKENQKVGFFNLNIARTGQLGYANDGGPFLSFLIGDGYDRYYTGVLFLSLHLKNTYDINLVELSFHKFTGHRLFTFETANQLGLSNMPYKERDNEINPTFYNQSRWRVSVGNQAVGLRGDFSLYNYRKLDIQDWLHEWRGDTYFSPLDKKPSYSLSFNYFYSNHL